MDDVKVECVGRRSTTDLVVSQDFVALGAVVRGGGGYRRQCWPWDDLASSSG